MKGGEDRTDRGRSGGSWDGTVGWNSSESPRAGTTQLHDADAISGRGITGRRRWKGTTWGVRAGAFLILLKGTALHKIQKLLGSGRHSLRVGLANSMNLASAVPKSFVFHNWTAQ